MDTNPLSSRPWGPDDCTLAAVMLYSSRSFLTEGPIGDDVLKKKEEKFKIDNLQS